jgi:hypothetical protein
VNGDIEERLQALRPAEPPAELLTRLLETEPVMAWKIRWIRFVGPLAAAAAVTLFAFPHFHARHPTQPQRTAETGLQPSDFRVFVPVEQTSTLLDVHNIAVVDVEPSRPMRFVRATWIEDVTYAGDDGHSTLRRREPHTAILSVPLDSF